MIDDINYKDVNDRKRFYKKREWKDIKAIRREIDNDECQWCNIDNLITVCFAYHENHHDRNIYKKKKDNWNDEWW